MGVLSAFICMHYMCTLPVETREGVECTKRLGKSWRGSGRDEVDLNVALMYKLLTKQNKKESIPLNHTPSNYYTALVFVTHL